MRRPYIRVSLLPDGCTRKLILPVRNLGSIDDSVSLVSENLSYSYRPSWDLLCGVPSLHPQALAIIWDIPRHSLKAVAIINVILVMSS